MFRLLTVGVLVKLIAIETSASEYPKLIEIFVNGSPPVIHHPAIEIRSYNIQNLGLTARTLSSQLSSLESVARQQAIQRIEKDFESIKLALKAEIELHLLIDQYGIEFFPVSVVDEHLLVYGDIDINSILTVWRQSSW